MESTFKPSEEQRKSILELFDNIKLAFEKVWDIFKKAAEAIASALVKYIDSIQNLDPRKRYKRLKRMGIKNYIPFFKRSAIHRCRNNC